MSSDWTPQDLFGAGTQTWMACAVQAAVKLDLFTALDGEGWLETAELAGKMACDARSVDMLATALTAGGFLERDGGAVRLTEPSRRYLSAKSDDYFGFILRHQANILRNWINLDEAVRTGTSVSGRTSQSPETEGETEDFLMGMFNVARLQAPKVTEALAQAGVLKDGGTVLDLGGGPGTYAVFFCRRFPELKATVFDQPGTEKFAASVFAQYGVADRVKFMGGDFLTSDLPGGFDLVWASQVLHGEAPADAARLIKRAAGCLAPGGRLCVQEFIIDDDRRGPVQPALFALNMLVQTPGGQAYTEGELKTMMTGAGLGSIRRLKAELPPGCGLIIGEKV